MRSELAAGQPSSPFQLSQAVNPLLPWLPWLLTLSPHAPAGLHGSLVQPHVLSLQPSSHRCSWRPQSLSWDPSGARRPWTVSGSVFVPEIVYRDLASSPLVQLDQLEAWVMPCPWVPCRLLPSASFPSCLWRQRLSSSLGVLEYWSLSLWGCPTTTRLTMVHDPGSSSSNVLSSFALTVLSPLVVLDCLGA